jgi:hypothetical protein
MARGNKLSINTLLEIDKLFRDQKWSISDNISNSSYGRFCTRLSILDQDEQNLILLLTKHFEKVPFHTYADNIWSAFFTIPENKLEKASKIIFMPLIDHKKRKASQTKSSGALHYILKSQEYDWIDYSSKFHFSENINSLNALFDENSILLLIDDFIGSGSTACDAVVSYFEAFQKLSSSNTSILSMIAQAEGINTVKIKTGCDVFANKTFKRGISDRFTGQTTNEYLSLMKKIEDKISSEIQKSDLSLGYKQSEALVSMDNRPPNNTFPVFWYETNDKLAPFPRYRNFKKEDNDKP